MIQQRLNSKGNVKKRTGADIPYNPKQAVQEEYLAVSTDGQTVINLPFFVDTSKKSLCWVIVDGKKLTFGASNDYTFTAVDSFGISSQITLVLPLVSDLNIAVYLMGTAIQDTSAISARVSDLTSVQSAALAPFVDTSAKLTATSGTPAAGQFYSSIVGRKPIVDLTSDLKAHIGTERIPVQQLYPLQDEVGPNGEVVQTAWNDINGITRYVGSWFTGTDTNGSYVNSSTSGTDYVELTFYGTGLNLLAYIDQYNRAYSYSVDGGSVISGNYPTTGSAVLTARKYATNQVLSVVSGLTLGVHTVKIIATGTTSTTEFLVYGFEVLNESSSIKINPGISYANGMRLVSSAQQTFAYNSGFESGTLGTRGGRVLVYQKSDGSIAKAVTPVNPTTINFLSSVDHTYEDIIRTYNWREFGAGRSDDFSLITSVSNQPAAFTLDDGTTTLSGNNIAGASSSTGNFLVVVIGGFYAFTFVGTGLDINLYTFVSPVSLAVSIDGVSIGNLPTGGIVGASYIQKIVSGLPYGTHTVKFTKVSAGNDLSLTSFMVYGPKKPVLPAGAIELADYNVMADYDGTAATSTSEWLQNPTGTLVKANTREFTYKGSWAAAMNASFPSGWNIYGSTINNQVTYTFFGTGINFLFNTNGISATDFTATIDGSLFTTGVARGNMTNLGGGSYRVTQTASAPSRVEFTGLTLGLHTITLENSISGRSLDILQAWIITPVHAPKSNLYSDIQNTLPVGSQGISDVRSFSPIKDVTPAGKSTAQAVGITAGPTTSSTAAVPLQDMSVVHYNKSGRIKISAQTLFNTGGSVAVSLYFVVDGVAAPFIFYNVANAYYNQVVGFYELAVSPGHHKIDVYWSVGSGVATATNIDRNLLVEEK